MQWKIDENGLVGPIDFDSEISELKPIIGEPTGRFKRTSESSDVIYAYDHVGIHLQIDSNNRICQIIVFPENEVFIANTQLLGKSINKVFSELNDFGVVVEREDAGLWCEAQKVLLVEVEGLVDGVEIYREV